MLDKFLRSDLESKLIAPMLRPKFWSKVKPAQLTLLSCAFGIIAAPYLVMGHRFLPFILLFLSLFFDLLDGNLARRNNQASNIGAVLDIFCDRVVEGLFLVAIALTGRCHAIYPMLALTSILLCVTAFLCVGIYTANHTQKGFYYSPGLVERPEAFIAFGLMLIFPGFTAGICSILASCVTLSALLHLKNFATYEKKRNIISHS